ncbi:MAG: DUF6057 family protein [Draconibacterium sp.]|nr:DUF6057 family protein [Draconibacterium sp.]
MKSEKFVIHILLAVLAIFSFLFCFIAVNTTLHHHYQQIAWQTGNLFLDYYLAFPGGPAEYMSLFISQFFISNILGSVLVAASGFLISFFLIKTIYLLQGKSGLLLLLVPFVQLIFLVLMCDYKFHFSVIINLIIVSGFLYLCTSLEKWVRFTVSFPTFFSGMLLYYISGGMYFLIFMASSLIIIIRKPDKNMFVNVSLILAETFLIPFIAYHFVFLSSLNNSFFRSTPDVAAMIRYTRPPVFYAGLSLIPTVLFLTKISAIISQNKKNVRPLMKKTGKAKIKKSSGFKFGDYRKIAFAVCAFLLVTVSGLILYKVYIPGEKAKIRIDYLASNQEWDDVITMVGKMTDYDRMVNFHYNRALSNSGQMLEKLFFYPQILGSQGLFLDKPFTSEVALPNSDIYFDLGNIDESQRYAFESETLMKNSPRVLKRLIINCIIMDKMEAANTYLNILAANPMEKKWVIKYLNYISNPSMAEADPLIAQKRKDMNQTEGMLGTPPLKLLSQLEKNPMNKAACEYLIAFDLMEHDVVSLTEDLKYLNQFNYNKLPVALEEAVILFRSQGKNYELLNQIKISDATTKRFREFAKLTSASKGDREKAKQATQAYKNTYWYYVLFLSPKVTNLKLDTKPVDANY